MISTLLAGLAIAQATSVWSVDPSGTLIWGGKPYVPLGLRVAGTPEAVEEAHSAGVQDLLVELPADGRSWPATFAALEKNKSRFMVEINSMAPASTGVVVEPESYRITGINQRTRIQANLPGAVGALILLVTADGAIQKTQRVSTDPNGRIDEEVDPGNTVEHVALVYPITKDSRFPDGWDGLDDHRDQVLSAFSMAGPMPGLRGLVNPIGSVARFPEAELRFVPTSARFRLELEVFLKGRYGTQRRAEQAWSIQAADFASFADMARLIPLWSPKRGVNHYWDPTTNRTYSTISKVNSAWADIQAVYNTALRRRMINLSQALQQRLGVPVVQTWSGWNGPYEGNAAGLAGVAVRLEDDSITGLLNGASKAASTLSRWDRTGLLLATDVRVRPDEGDYAAIPAVIDQSAGLGMRGWYFTVNDKESALRVGDMHVAFLDRDQWLTPRPAFLNFPESAQNPALPMLLGSNTWWVPAPLDGNRIDFGRKISGYRMRSADGDQTVFWSNQEPMKVRLRLLDPKAARVRAVNGQAVTTKISKTHIELQLTTNPIVVSGPEVPVPQECIDETLTEFASMAASVPTQVQNMVDDIESFRQVSTTINQNPSGAFLGMRSRLERLRRSLAPMAWVEAENSREHNFSEAQTDANACGQAALMLSTRLTPLEGLFRAKYLFNPRIPGNQEVWIAMRGSTAAQNAVYVTVNGERLDRAALPIASVYGNGYGWLNMGTVNLPMQQVNIEVVTPAPLIAPMSLDVVLLTPAGYKPNGPFLNWYPPLSVLPKRS